MNQSLKGRVVDHQSLGNSKAFEVYEDRCHKRKHNQNDHFDDMEVPNSEDRLGPEPKSLSVDANHHDAAWESGRESMSLRTRTPLADNRLKVNSTPNSSSQQSIKNSLSIKRSPGQKYRLQDTDAELPRKSTKLSHFDSPSRNKRHGWPSTNLELDSISNIEPPKSGNTARPSIFLEGSMNDRTSKCPPPEIIGVDALENDFMDIDSKPVGDTYATFEGGNVNMPRPAAMYNFNSPAKTWNPFKAFGKLFSWPSSVPSPSKNTESLISSKEVAEQVEAHLQGFEDRILGRLAALQAGDVQGSSSMHHKSAADLLRTTIAKETDGSPANTPAEASLSKPVPSSMSFSTPNLLIQNFETGSHSASQQESPAIVSETSRDPFATLQRLSGRASMALRNSVSPSKFKPLTVSEDNPHAHQPRNKTARPRPSISDMLNVQGLLGHSNLSSPNDDCPEGVEQMNTTRASSSLEFKELPELPGLKNKASQHLKKMASKMTLRNRKSKREDTLMVNSHEYRVMKRKNKEDILKDYLALQKEKLELEKQLAHGLAVSQSTTIINKDLPTISSAEDQLQQEIESATMHPVLLSATTPDFRVESHESASLRLDEKEQEPVKRNTRQASKSLMSASLPLELIHEDRLETKQDHDMDSINQELCQAVNFEGVTKNNTESTEKDSPSNERVKTSSGCTSPVKHRSKVLKPARDSKVHTPKNKTDAWTGWDDDIF